MTAFLRPRPVARPTLRLLVFHHAGGSASVYFPLVRALPPSWDLLLYDLPGRGQRHAEAPLRRIDAIVEQAGRDFEGWLDAPFALFGHSLGAIVAGEFARAATAAGRPPVWLGVSARQGPSESRGLGRVHELGDADLIETLFDLGGIPAKIAEEREFLQLFLAIARADLEAVDAYEPEAVRAASATARYPITAFAGSVDPRVAPEQMRSWQDESCGSFTLLPFEGGHFYFLGANFPAFAAAVATSIAAAIADGSERR